jgi:hypothetical protein
MLVFDLKFGDTLIPVTKITAGQLTEAHRQILMQARYEQQKLSFPDERWHSLYLGAGEEKAVFCVCDDAQRVFAVELIDERHYLNGRFVGGQYFFNLRVPALANVKAQHDSDFGLMFTGLIKVREFVYGYEWARFQFDPQRKTAFDHPLTAFLQSGLMSQFRHYQSQYRDVHDRNVLFEILPINGHGVPVILRTWAGRLTLAKVRLQPVDVR